MRDPSCTEIRRVTCRYLGVTIQEFEAKRRDARTVHCRHLAIYLMCKMTNTSFTRMGVASSRHHSTCIHARDSIIEQLEKGDIVLANTIEFLKKKIRAEVEKDPLMQNTPGEESFRDKEALV